ncbi:MAG: SDR family oxidoreductase [SAR324 cluster bacterium]|nr:SDR family oxidoreductase [SAR324 cluster bacterium]
MENSHLAHSNVLIYGATGGIGRAIAKEAIAHEATPLLLGRDSAKLKDLAQELGLSDKFWCATHELTEGNTRINSWLEQHAPITLAVHAAGRGVMKPLTKITPKEWEEVIEVNLSSAYHFFNLLWPHKNEKLDMVFFGSASTHQAWAKNCLYGASKAGLAYFCKALQKEIQPKGGRVWLYELGAVDTPYFDNISNHIPKEKMICPKELAKWVLSNLNLSPGLFSPNLSLLSD